MAQIYNDRLKEEILNTSNNIHKETIYKMLELQDILTTNPPNDKKFLNNISYYLIDYIKIINSLDYKDYSDEKIIKNINKLYKKVFKDRRV